MESWQTNSRRHRPGSNRPDSDSILLHNSVNNHQCKAHKGYSLLHLHLKAWTVKTGLSSTVSFYGFKTMIERPRKHLGIILMALPLCWEQILWIWIHNMTCTCTRSGSPGSRLLQETKVGRSIQESPLILLPSYTTWNSPTENFHRRRHPSVVNYHTEKKEHLCMYAIFWSWTFQFTCTFKLEQQNTFVGDCLDLFHIVNMSNKCVACCSSPKKQEDWVCQMCPDRITMKTGTEMISQLKDCNNTDHWSEI